MAKRKEVLQQYISVRHRDGVEDDSGLSDKNIERFREGLPIRQPQMNRLKTIKRQMYGRAGVELLRARLIPLPMTPAAQQRE